MGKPTARLGDPLIPEGCYSGGHVLAVGSGNVMINGKPAVRLGDPTTVHCCGPSCHSSVCSAGAGSVMVNGKPAVRLGDPMACGSTVGAGSGNVMSQ